MGLLSKLKEFLVGKDIETIVEFEAELGKLITDYGLSNAAIIGIGGRLKGLPLIYSSEDEGMLKNLTAKIPEVIGPLDSLEPSKAFERTIIKYRGSFLVLIKLTENIAFVGISEKKISVEDSVKWIKSKEDLIHKLFER
ncbi:MAG: hypothetical protein BAJALOKI2v1_50066 [Promethearchaeota archaeon]|nr:MAG: hypothetical protein BAJALOKI2v1_50066 [Candidatus Lokiarchaeota archaeon]